MKIEVSYTPSEEKLHKKGDKLLTVEQIDNELKKKMGDMLDEYDLRLKESDEDDRLSIDFRIIDDQGHICASAWGASPDDVEIECDHPAVELMTMKPSANAQSVEHGLRGTGISAQTMATQLKSKFQTSGNMQTKLVESWANTWRV